MRRKIYEKNQQESVFVTHCKEMIKDVNSILAGFEVKPKPRRESHSEKFLTKEFINAIAVLSTRVKSAKPLKPCLNSRPVLSVSSALGPGSYSIQRSFTPILSPAPYISKINIDSYQKRSPPGSCKRHRLSTKKLTIGEHNKKIEAFLEKRKAENIELMLKNRIKFKEERQTMHTKSNAQWKCNLIRASVCLFITFSVSCSLARKCKYQSKLKSRSKHFLVWLYNVMKFVGKLRKILRKIRRKIAYKNIIILATPMFKFMINKREILLKKVFKGVTRILQMNQLFLLCCKWKRAIYMIQYWFRSYLKVKRIRIQTLIKMCEKAADRKKHTKWCSATPKDQYELIEKFLLDETYFHSRKMSRYISDKKLADRRLYRNYAIIKEQLITQSYGRALKIAVARPFFSIFSMKKSLKSFINDCEHKLQTKCQLQQRQKVL